MKKNERQGIFSKPTELMPPFPEIMVWNEEKFHKAMVTKDFIYYMNEYGGDDNGGVLMWNRENGGLVSDNYFATNDLFENLLYFNYLWVNRDLQYSRRCILEECKLELAKEFVLKQFSGSVPNSRTIKKFSYAHVNHRVMTSLGFQLTKDEFQKIRTEITQKQKSNGMSL